MRKQKAMRPEEWFQVVKAAMRSNTVAYLKRFWDDLQGILRKPDTHFESKHKLTPDQIVRFRKQAGQLLDTIRRVLPELKGGRTVDEETMLYIGYTWGYLSSLIRQPYYEIGRKRTAGSSAGGLTGGRSKAEQARPGIDKRDAEILKKAHEMKQRNPHMTRNAIAARMAENEMFMTIGEHPEPLKQSTYNRILGKDPHFKK